MNLKRTLLLVALAGFLAGILIAVVFGGPATAPAEDAPDGGAEGPGETPTPRTPAQPYSPGNGTCIEQPAPPGGTPYEICE